MSKQPASVNFETSRTISFFRGINRLFMRVYHRVEVLSPPQLPKHGPAILVSNHISGIDPLVIQSVVSRPIVWMMAKEYYEIRALRWLFQLAEAIPVERSGKDLAAMRSALRALENGRILGVFPEGRIEPGQELLPFQTGIALMAVRTGAPVHCCLLEGSSRGREMLQAFSRRCEMQVAFSRECKIDRTNSGRESLQTATELIQQEVNRLRQNKVDKINRL